MPLEQGQADRAEAHHLSPRQYARIVKPWVALVDLHTHDHRAPPAAHQGDTHLPADEKPAGGAALLGHTKFQSMARYLGCDVDDAIEIAEQIEV